MSVELNHFVGQDQQGQNYVVQGQYIGQNCLKPCRSKSTTDNIVIRTSSIRKRFCRLRSIMAFGAKICRARSIRTVGQCQLFKLGQDQRSRLGQVQWVPPNVYLLTGNDQNVCGFGLGVCLQHSP